MRNKIKITTFMVLLTISTFSMASKIQAKTIYPEPISPVKQFILDDMNVYTIKVPKNKGVTTVMFPSAISGIYGSGIAIKVKDDNKVQSDFLLSYSPNSYYFSLVALKDNAKGALNIVFNRKVYVIKLFTAETSKAYSSVTFMNSRDISEKKNIGATVLSSILDKAKNYTLYAKYYPDSLNGCEYVGYEKIFTYGAYDIKLMGVYRFDSADTLIFHILFKNKTNNELTYKTKDMAVRLGDKIYFASIADASGVIPPQSQTQAYFGVTGTPSGGKNNLSADNSWKVLIATTSSKHKIVEVTPSDKLRQQQIELESKANYLNNLLTKPNLSEKDFVKIKIKAQKIKAEYKKVVLQINTINNQKQIKQEDKAWTGRFYIPKNSIGTE